MSAVLLLVFTLGVVTSCVTQTNLEGQPTVETSTEISLDEPTLEEEHLGQSNGTPHTAEAKQGFC